MTKPSETPSLPLSLKELRERVLAPEAEREDLDALLVEMTRPARPDEDLRARADVLHRLIEDPVLRGLRGRDMRRVDETAVCALVALGEPYASELSAEGRKILQSVSPKPIGEEANEAPEADEAWSWGPLIGGVAIAWSVAEVLLPVVSLGTELLSKDSFKMMFVAMLCAGLTLFVPGLLLSRRSLGPVTRSVFVVLILLTGLVMGGIGLIVALFVNFANWTSTSDGQFALMMLVGALVRFGLVGGLVAEEFAPESSEPE
jgi:hypothetical protein